MQAACGGAGRGTLKNFLCSFLAASVVLCANTLCSTSTHAASFDPKLHWQQLKSPHFMIYFDERLASVVQRTAKYAEEAYDTLTVKYDWKPLGRTAVVLTDTNDAANGLATVLPYNYLLLRVSAPRPETPLAYYDNWMRMLVTHELTHIIHMDQARGVMKIPRLFLGKIVATNGILPGWMREGLAVHEESTQTRGGRNNGTWGDMMLRTEVLRGKQIKIDQADGLGWRWPNFLPQYIHGGRFLEWLSQTYGEENLIKYQKKVAASPLFFMNNFLAKRVWKKSFYTLWKEWQAFERQTYGVQLAKIADQGVTPLRTVANTGASLSALAVSPDGTKLVYTLTDPHTVVQIRMRDLRTGEEQTIRRKQGATSATFSADGKRLAFSALGVYKRYRFYSDIYVYDIDAGKLSRLTAGHRAQDPTFAPDGKTLVYVIEKSGMQRLACYDFAHRTETLFPASDDIAARFATPRISPDGKSIAVSSWQHGQQDLYLYSLDGKHIERVTNDTAMDIQPAWDKSGRFLYFSSDKSGVPNIARFDARTHQIERVTNVQTGVFEPAPLPNGKSLLVQEYTGTGFDISEVDVGKIYDRAPGARAVPSYALTVDEHGLPRNMSVGALNRAKSAAAAAAVADAQSSDYPTKKYNPFGPKLFFPRYMVPGVATTSGGVLLSAITGSSDPLHHHVWQAGATYNTDSKHVGYLASYVYNRYTPIFSLGVVDYSVDFGNLTFIHSDGTLNTVHLYEKRTRGSVGVAFPIKSRHSVAFQYFMENRNNIPTLTAEERALLNLDRFAGFSATYAWSRNESYPASISTEKGHRLLANFTITDKMLGSSERNEQQIFVGDWREFVKMPWLHHVLALHLKGGITWGDRLVQGTFGMGGSLGEGTLGGGGSLYYFPLRGIPVSSFSKTRALLASVEYRIPLVSTQRGLGTWPIFIQNIHAAAFADYGDAWNANEYPSVTNDFLLGTGVELRGDFVVGHGLPVQARLGYGIVVRNCNRLAFMANDPVLGTATKNGNLILQIGTAF